MQIKKFWFALAAGLLSMLFLVQPSPAGTSNIVTTGKQAVNLTGTSDSSGIISSDSVQQIKPDGSKVPFQPPSGTVVVINQVFAAFYYGINPPSDQSVTFQVGPFYNVPGYLSGGSAGFQDNLDPGVVIGDAKFKMQVVDATNTVVPGSLTFRAVGYYTPAP